MNIRKIFTTFGALNPPFSDIDKRNILVIGASSGIGLAVAKLLVKSGAKVYVSARRGYLLEKHFKKTEIFQTDVTKTKEIDKLFEEIKSKNLNIDSVFWCPGIYTPMNFKSFDITAAEQTVHTNFLCIFKPFSLMINYWINNKKHFSNKSIHWIWISSVAGYKGLPGSVAYGPSKSAMNNLAESSYTELKPHDINITLVCPGFVHSRLTKKNTFKMPAIISPEEAALSILKGLKQGKFEIHFPKRFTIVLKLIELLPYWIYFRIIKKLQ